MKDLDKRLKRMDWAVINGYLSAIDNVYEDVQNNNHLPEDFRSYHLESIHRINRTTCVTLPLSLLCQRKNTKRSTASVDLRF